MKVIHSGGYSRDELLQFKPLIHANVMQAISMLENASDTLGIPLKNKTKLRPSDPVNQSNAPIIKEFIQDPAVKELLARRNEFQFLESAPYFFQCVDRLADPNYVPTVDDGLRCRVRTSGVLETEFKIENTSMRMVDVGGQRTERSKWIHCFEGVTAVLFCVSLSEYDQKLEEDNATNRMHESLRVFQDVSNSKWFANTPIILFLNKRDVFEEKIKKVDLNPVCFTEYQGGKDFDKAVAYIKSKFVEVSQNKQKPIYCHVTTATDTKNIAVVFAAVKDIVLRRMVQETGLEM